MIVIEIEANPNCEPVDMRVFHDTGPVASVGCVRLEREAARGPEWFDVTGWTMAGAPCPALAQKVDDSGDGVAFLVRGGDAGLRLKPSGRDGWRLDASEQWGEPFLLIADEQDFRVSHVRPATSGGGHP